MANAAALTQSARAYLDVPFRHLGRSRAGLDCIGLHVLALRDIGAVVEDKLDYDKVPDPSDLLSYLSKCCDTVPQAEIGDYGLFWFNKAKEPQHLALFTDRGMIHTWSRPGKVVEHAFDEYWQKRLVSVWRLTRWQQSH